jgi:hypothetical protein
MTSLKPPNKLKNTTISGTLPDPTINLDEHANIYVRALIINAKKTYNEKQTKLKQEKD